jgi:hypothetical protein
MFDIRTLADLKQRTRTGLGQGRRRERRHFATTCVAIVAIFAFGAAAGIAIWMIKEKDSESRRTPELRAATAIVEMVGPHLMTRHSLEELRLRLSVETSFTELAVLLRSNENWRALNYWLLLSQEQQHALFEITKAYAVVPGQEAPYPCALKPTNLAVRRGNELLWTCAVLIPPPR